MFIELLPKYVKSDRLYKNKKIFSLHNFSTSNLAKNRNEINVVHMNKITDATFVYCNNHLDIELSKVVSEIDIPSINKTTI